MQLYALIGEMHAVMRRCWKSTRDACFDLVTDEKQKEVIAATAVVVQIDTAPPLSHATSLRVARS
jgi:hypothetical protein